MNKQKLLRRIHGDISRSLGSTRESIEKTRQQAIEAPGAMESKSDTTKAQMSNVATTLQGSYESGLKALGELEALIANPSQSARVASCSLVEVRDASGSKEVYLLLPAGGGNTYEIDGEEVFVISDRAPLACALVNHVVGDGVIVKTAGNTRTLTIVAIS